MEKRAMKKFIEKPSFFFFILIAFLMLTSWPSIAQEQECVSGVEPESDENGFYCPSDYPILCSTCVTSPAYFCCPESHILCGLGIDGGCCTCAAEMAYKDNKESLTLLREFRDNIMSQSPIGQELIRLYYQLSPVIVRAMEEDEEFKEKVREMIDEILPLIEGEVE
jgi:hypothetical protein